MPLEIVRNDITKMQVDAIVNTANPRPIVGGGVDRAIHKAAGPELLLAREKIGDISTGRAFITPAYNLNANYVIHTVGPVWQDGKQGERELLTSCYHNSLKLAVENNCTSIAFPLISAGVFGCPPEIAIAVAISSIRDFIFKQDIEVYLVVFDRASFKISSGLFNDVQNYIDEVYVTEQLAEEYRGDIRRRERMFHERHIAQKRSLNEMLDNISDSFSELLIKLIDAKGKTDPEVYKKANISRKHFSKIRNNPAYKPKKETAIAFAIALELSLKETQELLNSAGFALSHSNEEDIVIEYFIRQGNYDIFTINEVLFERKLSTLGY